MKEQDPFTALGLPVNVSIEESRKQYRKLAMLHHPDRGGDTETFKRIQVAWQQIEGGYKFTAPFEAFKEYVAPHRPFTGKPQGRNAGKPAPGYEERGPVQMPRTVSRKTGRSNEWSVDLELSQQHLFEGCTIPFLHHGNMHEYVVRPGTPVRRDTHFCPRNTTIGATNSGTMVHINLILTEKKPAYEDIRRDVQIKFELSALSLFVGGSFEVKDHLGSKITVKFDAGYNPSAPLKAKGKGYGLVGDRGDVLIQIIPVFKAPQELNDKELQLLSQFNNMVKK